MTFAPILSVLRNEAKARLRALLKGRKDTAVRTLALGFVQPTLGTANDQSLSLARADSLKSYLRKLGLKGPVTARGDGVSSESGAAGRKMSVSIRYTLYANESLCAWTGAASPRRCRPGACATRRGAER